MSRWRLEYLFGSLAACVLVAQPCACHVGKADVHSTHSTRSTHSMPSPPLPPSTPDTKQGEAHGDALHGACSQTDRAEHVHDPNLKFVGHVRACSKETWADKAKNIACLTKALPSLSKGCAGCFADMASCALANCKTACMFSSTSESCNNCANSHCQPSLVRCTGVARADLP